MFPEPIIVLDSAPVLPVPYRCAIPCVLLPVHMNEYWLLKYSARYAGFTAMLPTMAGAANRCVIPEHKFDPDLLTKSAD